MVWVKSEYAGELAVVSAWLSALVPWYVGYVPSGPLGSAVLYVRWPFLQVRYFLGVGIGENLDTYPVTSPWGAAEIDFAAVGPAYDLWVAGAAIVGLTALLGVGMYLRLERVEALLPVSPVRLVGGLLTLAGVVLAASAVQFVRLAPGTEYPLPVGVPIVLFLGLSLLRVDLVGGAAEGTDDDGDVEDGDDDVAAEGDDGGDTEDGDGDGDAAGPDETGAE